MLSEPDSTTEHNFEVFREVFFSSLSALSDKPNTKSSNKRRTVGTKNTVRGTTSASNTTTDGQASLNDPSELVEFSDFIAREVFEGLPEDLRGLSHQKLQDDVQLAEKWSLPLTMGTMEELAAQISPAVADSLMAYGLIDPPRSDLQSFLSPTISVFISASTVPPPLWSATRPTACEICERDWVPLTYHHLIPRGVHAKVLKRGWHDEAMLNSVAWLCRACHTFVHKMASNEELAREWYTVDKICSREDTQKWAQWVGRVRWRKQ